MGKKDFKGLHVYMEDKSEEKTRSSRHFIDIVTSHPNFEEEDLKQLKARETTHEEVILKIFSINKKDDPEAFFVFKDSLLYLMRDYRKRRLKHAYILHAPIEITRLFDTNEKLHHFLAYLMDFTLENTLDKHKIMMHINASFAVDYSVFLKILESWIVDFYEADIKEVSNYLNTFFLLYDNASFMCNCIFAHHYKILSTKVSDMIHCRSRSKKEIKKAWTDAIYEDELGDMIHIRQVAFSQKQIDNIVHYAEKSYSNHPLDNNLYTRFKSYLQTPTLEQICYGKDAGDLARSRQKSEEPIPLFFKYTRTI